MDENDLLDAHFENHRETNLTKYAAIIAPLHIKNDLHVEFKLTNGCTLKLRQRDELYTALNKFFQNENAAGITAGSYISYEFDTMRTERTVFEGHEKTRLLCYAVRVYTGNRCDLKVIVALNDAGSKIKYYRPYALGEQYGDYLDYRSQSKIENINDVEALENIYHKLDVLDIDRSHAKSRVPRLTNAMNIFNSSHDVHWYLLKVTLLLITLESLFTDSSKSEVTYKIALRTSFFLYPSDVKHRRRAFELIKLAYDLRSQFVHGMKVNDQKLTKRLSLITEDDGGGVAFNLPPMLYKIVCETLKKALLDAAAFSHFGSIQKEGAESAFFDQLVLDS